MSKLKTTSKSKKLRRLSRRKVRDKKSAKTSMVKVVADFSLRKKERGISRRKVRDENSAKTAGNSVVANSPSRTLSGAGISSRLRKRKLKFAKTNMARVLANFSSRRKERGLKSAKTMGNKLSRPKGRDKKSAKTMKSELKSPKTSMVKVVADFSLRKKKRGLKSAKTMGNKLSRPKGRDKKFAKTVSKPPVLTRRRILTGLLAGLERWRRETWRGKPPTGGTSRRLAGERFLTEEERELLARIGGRSAAAAKRRGEKLAPEAVARLEERVEDFARAEPRWRVVLAAPPSEVLAEKIRRRLEAAGAEGTLEIAVQPEIIAGVVVEGRGRRFDYSLRRFWEEG